MQLHLLFGGALLLTALAPATLAEPEQLDVVLVEADRLSIYDEAVQVPGQSTVIPSELIEKSAATSVAELLETRVGLPFGSFFSDPALGSPVVRGFGENSSSRTLILLDGIPMNRPDLGSAPWFQFPLTSLEQVEVMKGSRTVRYGSAALGGVIALETKSPTERREGSLEAIAGEFDSRIYRASLSLPLGGWGLSFHAESNESEGYRQNSGYDSSSWGAVLQSPQDAVWRGKWFFSGNELIFENPDGLSDDAYFQDPRQSRNVRFGIEDQFVNENVSVQAAQTLSWDWGEEGSFEWRMSWMDRERESNFGAESHSDQDLVTLFTEAVISQKGESVAWQIGVRGQCDDIEDIRYGELERINRRGEADLARTNIGIFALARYEFADRWAFAAGAGWDRWDLKVAASDFENPTDEDLNFQGTRSDDGFAGEVSLEYESDSAWKAWLRYDRIYRFPVIDEIAAYQGFILPEPFNADLKAETGHSLEVGWDYQAHSWSWESTVFSQWLDGEITFDFRQNKNVNFARTHRLGIENSWSQESGAWEFWLNHNSTLARYRSGDFEGKSIALVPKHVLAGGVAWKPVKQVTLGLGAHYIGSSPEGNDFENSQTRLPSRWLLNSQLKWSLSEGAELFLKVDNLLDRRHATLKYVGQWYPGSGRKVSFGGRWKF